MRALVLNCGSSTLKFDLIEAEAQGATLSQSSRLAHGLVDRIGRESRLEFTANGEPSFQETTPVLDYRDAAKRVLDWLDSTGEYGINHLEAVGHRVVHGGERFSEPTLINEAVIEVIEEVSQLAPLHNGPSLQVIRAVRELLGTEIPMVAVFDTAFHRDMPEVAARYAIPHEVADRHHIRRYGFHGIAHRYMAERYSSLVGKPMSEVNLVTLQLGNGCSVAAVAGGRSLDTSMGLTPLEGLVMGTRSGDVDPTLVSFLAQHEGVEIDEAEKLLNQQSGLLGVSGRSGDMRELLEAERQGDARASLAIDLFCYRARKYIGAYLAVLGGADAVVFGGGIGENSPEVRERICAGMGWCGLLLDQARNASAAGTEARISPDCTAIQVYVVPVDEAAIIALDTFRCLQRTDGPL